MRFFGNKPKPSTIADEHTAASHNLSETVALVGTTADDYALNQRLDSLLDTLRQQVAASDDLFAEVMIAVPHERQLVTLRLRPDDSVALYFRVRENEGLIGQVFHTGKPFVGPIDRLDVRARGTGSSGDVSHLLNTQSMLILPLLHANRVFGVVNLESPQAATLSHAVLQRLTHSQVIAELLQELLKVKLEALTPERIERDLLDKCAQHIMFAVEPENLDGLYYQILQVATQLINEPDVSGGLVLIKDATQQLARRDQNAGQYWMVRAAQIGAFNSEKEWRLEGKSIARRAITTRQPQNVRDVRNDPDYRSSGTGFAESAELVVPLVDSQTPIGVIGLVSPKLRTFDDHDARNIQELADIAVRAIKRGEMIAAGQRSEQQLRCARELLKVLEPLSPSRSEGILQADIANVREQVLSRIVGWACDFTEADCGTILLAEKIPGKDTQLIIHASRGLSTAEGDRQRFPITTGVSGTAFRTGLVQNVPDVSTIAEYFPYFQGAQSEIAMPLLRGGEGIGVLDVESRTQFHFTTAHQQWVEFLGEQAAYALAAVELAQKNKLELILELLSEEIDNEIAKMHQLPNDAVRPLRDGLLKRVLETLRDLSGAVIGRLLVGVNAYVDEAETEVDLDHGLLYYMISTNELEVAGNAQRYFPLTVGVSGITFRNRERIVFNDVTTRPKAFFANQTHAYAIESGIFIPIQEGTKITGVMDIESEQAGAFTADIIEACQKGATLISKLLTAARLRLRKLQADLLRNFESRILLNQNADIQSFMQLVLNEAKTISHPTSGWGQVTLLRPQVTPDTYITDVTFAMDYEAQKRQDNTAFQQDDQRQPVTYQVFRMALETHQPVLVLDTANLQTASERKYMPWPAQSLICVPLLRPKENQPDEQEAIGILALAAPDPSMFSEADKVVLKLFAQSIISGLNNIALLGARKAIIREATHDFSKAVPSLLYSRNKVLQALQEALTNPSPTHDSLDAIDVRMKKLNMLIRLMTSLMNWFFDYTDDELQPDALENTPLNFNDITKEMADPINALADAVKRYSVAWIAPIQDVRIMGGEVRKRLICAILFKFLENAIKYSAVNDIRVNMFAANSTVVLAVSNTGTPIDPADSQQLFILRFRSPQSALTSMGSGIGLFQASEIAQSRLYGNVTYHHDAGRNVFSLVLPAYHPEDRYAPVTQKRGE